MKARCYCCVLSVFQFYDPDIFTSAVITCRNLAGDKCLALVVGH
jgi:hypothetical protein